jgi:hypothetical protein
MRPGADCIACHSASGEGPRFTIAGTVHAAFDEPTDCLGVAGVSVSVTDTNGTVVDLVTNSAGNFYTKTALAMPIHARLSFEGRERVMTLAPQVGACASCHTETGANNAPGRILAP